MVKQITVTISTIITFFVLLFIYTKLNGPIPFQISSTTTTKSTTFDVTGAGKANIKPNSANISAGVSTTGSSVKQTQDDMNSLINKVSAAIKELGIDPKDIQTSNYNVNPTYDYTLGSQKITGYNANTNLTIKVKDIGKINQVIDAATKNGATNVSTLGFEATDKTAAENEARKIAVAEAKKKAEDAAKIAGFRLGNLVNYSENFGGYPGPRPMMNAAVGKAEDVSTQIETGSSEVQVNVTLSYEIR